MPPFLSKATSLLFFLLASTLTLLAQADQATPYNVNSPTEKVPTAWYETPFLWLGLLAFVLVGVLLYLRKGKSATYNKLHKY